MKLKRILYCILSLVVVLSFLPGCELFLKEPKKTKKPKKEKSTKKAAPEGDDAAASEQAEEGKE